MRKKFKGFLSIIGFLLFCIITIMLLYFVYVNFFQKQSVIKVSGPLSINYENGTHLNIIKNKDIGIKIVNNSEEDAYYYLEFTNVKNAKNVEWIIKNNGETLFQNPLNNFNSTVLNNILIKAGETHQYTISFASSGSLLYSLDVNVNVQNLQSFNFAEIILNNNVFKDAPITTVGKEVALSNEGLIKSEDDDGVSYYFRGKVDNNYVLLNEMLFRIVRINGDGSVRLILNDGLPVVHKYYADIQKIAFEDSDIYTYLNEWLENNLYSSYDLLSITKYCNDILKDGNTYLSYNRIDKDNIPSLSCVESKANSKIGLLSVDEAIFAGATLHSDNKDFYLYNSKIDTDYFTMTSYSMSSNIYFLYSVTSSGKISHDAGNNLRLIRPVISIVNTAVATGSGTYDDPYVLTAKK